MFSLRTLFVAVAYAALICAALLYRTSLLSSVIFSLTIATGLFAALAAWRFPEQRAFYVVVAMVIAFYMTIVFYGRLQVIEENLFTTQVIFLVWDRIATGNPFGSQWQEAFYTSLQGPLPFVGNVRSQALELRAFYYTIHSAAALLVGLWAGWMTVWMEKKPDAEAKQGG